MKTLRALFGIAFIVVAVYVCWMLVPPYFNDYRLADTIDEEARMNTYTPKTEDQMRDAIFRKARDMDMPITREQINVQREAQAVTIWVDYRVHLDFPVHPVDLDFHPKSKNKAY